MDDRLSGEQLLSSNWDMEMQKPIRLLILEDRLDDVDLILTVLCHAGLIVDAVSVVTRDDYLVKIQDDEWDAICADFIVPGFGAAEALEILRSKGKDTPFIILSGIAKTEDVVTLMKSGAGDFVQKDDLVRLAPAIVREIRETNDRRARDKAERQLEKLSRAVEQSPVSVVILNELETFEYTNRQFSLVNGFLQADVLGTSFTAFHQRSGQAEAVKTGLSCVREGGTWQGEIKSLRKDGTPYWESMSISSLRDSDTEVTHFVVVAEDITLRKVYEERLLRQAHFDELTNLPNRFLAVDRLSLAIARAKRQNVPLAVAFIDLDDFKKVNDTLGHTCGDMLLKEAANRLRSCVRVVDTVGRLGGDEFVVILPDLAEVSNVEIVAEKILNAFRCVFNAAGHAVTCTASIGITIFPNDGDDPQTLLRNADSAMYQAKQQGKSIYRYYTQRMNDRARRRLAIEEGLREALPSDEIFIEFQPIKNLRNGQLSGMEALVRWSNSGLGGVPPLEFIPVAEDAGLIQDLGSYVLITACHQCRNWSDLLKQPLRLSVNVSSRQIRESGFVDLVGRALDQSGLRPDCLELEITERLLISDEQLSRNTLVALRNRGIRLAIDDFGTGYSSLSYVKKFPITTVKIDRSFIEGVPRNSEDVALSRAIIAMAHALELEVVAEGVERPNQEKFLLDEGCDRSQGFLYSRPLSRQDFTSYMATRHGA